MVSISLPFLPTSRAEFTTIFAWDFARVSTIFGRHFAEVRPFLDVILRNRAQFGQRFFVGVALEVGRKGSEIETIFGLFLKYFCPKTFNSSWGSSFENLIRFLDLRIKFGKNLIKFLNLRFDVGLCRVVGKCRVVGFVWSRLYVPQLFFFSSFFFWNQPYIPYIPYIPYTPPLFCVIYSHHNR